MRLWQGSLWVGIDFLLLLQLRVGRLISFAEPVHDVLRRQLGAIRVWRAAQPLLGSHAQITKRRSAEQTAFVPLSNLHGHSVRALPERRDAGQPRADPEWCAAQLGRRLAILLSEMLRLALLFVLQSRCNRLVEVPLPVASRTALKGFIEVTTVIDKRSCFSFFEQVTSDLVFARSQIRQFSQLLRMF